MKEEDSGHSREEVGCSSGRTGVKAAAAGTATAAEAGTDTSGTVPTGPFAMTRGECSAKGLDRPAGRRVGLAGRGEGGQARPPQERTTIPINRPPRPGFPASPRPHSEKLRQNKSAFSPPNPSALSPVSPPLLLPPFQCLTSPWRAHLPCYPTQPCNRRPSQAPNPPRKRTPTARHAPISHSLQIRHYKFLSSRPQQARLEPSPAALGRPRPCWASRSCAPLATRRRRSLARRSSVSALAQRLPRGRAYGRTPTNAHRMCMLDRAR